MGVAPMYLAVFRTARWPYWREEMTYTSAGFSMAAMALIRRRKFGKGRFEIDYQRGKF